MAIAIGIFSNKDAVTDTLGLLKGQSISKRNVALVVRDDASDAFVKPINASGFLRSGLAKNDIRMVEGMVLTALVNAGIEMFEAVAYMKAVKRGYTLLAVQSSSSQSPWVAEAMRRAGAVTAIDSATEAAMAALPYDSRRQYFASHRLPVH